MPQANRDPYRRETAPFVLDGEWQRVEVATCQQRVRRLAHPSGEVLEETHWPVSQCGCSIHELAPSPSGRWLVTQRYSGQGEWGYDLFSTSPLARVAGVVEEKGYILDLPTFATDESYIIGGAGRHYLGGWWAHPHDEPDEPSRGGPTSLGFLFLHRLPGHVVTRHELRVYLPAGWVPDDPWAAWYGPRDIIPTATGIRFMPSWGVPFEVPFPLPEVISLPVPHPSGSGLL